MEEREFNRKMFVTEIGYTPWLGLGRIRELGGWCYNHGRMDFRRGRMLDGRLISYHTYLSGSSPLFLRYGDYYHPNIKLTYKPFCHCIEEKQSSKYTDNFFLRPHLPFRRLIEEVVFFESNHP